MKKKRVLNKKKLFIFLIIILAIIGVGVVGVKIVKNLNVEVKTEKKEKKEKEVKDKIDEYGYTLNENQTDYYNKLFNELKDVLNADELNEKAYAESVAKIFAADYFNLDNKVTNTDIGGTQFVYEEFRKDFVNISKGGIYNYIESNVYDERKQSLPKVTNVEVVSTENTNYKYGDKNDSNAYVVNLKITYAEDLGYQKSITLYLVHNDKKLEIVEMK